jgi:hypothetical protein
MTTIEVAVTAPAAEDVPPVQMYIAGAWTDGTSGATLPLIDPATEATIGTVPLA